MDSSILSLKLQQKPYQRTSRFKVGLGNSHVRYNSQVINEKNKLYTHSTRNSSDAPQWMSTTKKYFLRDNLNKSKNLFQYKNLNTSMYINPQGAFTQIKQKNIYQNISKSNNLSGQFQMVTKKKPRNKWQMKQSTFQFSWPNKIAKQVPIKSPAFASSGLGNIGITNYISTSSHNQENNKIRSFFKYEMPKYAIRQSPLHRQKQTPVKIGHSAMINSIYNF